MDEVKKELTKTAKKVAKAPKDKKAVEAKTETAA